MTSEHSSKIDFMPEAHGAARAIVSHEGRTAVYAWLANQTEPQTNAAMITGIRDQLRDTEVEWLPSNPGHYVTRSFIPDFAEVIPLARSRGYVEGYRARSAVEGLGKAAAGLAARFGLTHPDFSVQEILGPSQTDVGMRTHVLNELVDGLESDTWKSVSALLDTADITADAGDRRSLLSLVWSSVEKLERRGLVIAEHAKDDNDSRYHIHELVAPRPDYNPSKLRLAVHDFLLQKTEQGLYEFTHQECLNFVTQHLSAQDPEFESYGIRAKLANLLSAGRSMRGIERLGTFNRGAHTRIFLEPTYAQPVKDLLKILRTLHERDEEVMAAGQAEADQLAHNAPDLARLFDKSFQFSYLTNPSPRAVTAERLLSLLEDEPAQSGEQLKAAYEASSGRSISISALHALMRILAREGRVRIDKTQTDPTRGHRHNAYTRIDE